VREKLQRIELEAETACVRARTLTDQARAAHDEQQRLARRLEELRATHPTLHPGQWVRDPSAGPSARRWHPAIGDNLDDLQRELDQTTTDLERLTHERDAAQERWTSLGQLAAKCRAYLGL
jgi:predicted phage gp36 major capsid-like protein